MKNIRKVTTAESNLVKKVATYSYITFHLKSNKCYVT